MGFETPTKKKTFKQAKLEVAGKNMRLYEASVSDHRNFSAETMPTTSAKPRGRPRNDCTTPVKVRQPRKSNRKAKVKATSVIKHLYTNSKKRGKSLEKLVKNDTLFYI